MCFSSLWIRRKAMLFLMTCICCWQRFDCCYSVIRKWTGPIRGNGRHWFIWSNTIPMRTSDGWPFSVSRSSSNCLSLNNNPIALKSRTTRNLESTIWSIREWEDRSVCRVIDYSSMKTFANVLDSSRRFHWRRAKWLNLFFSSLEQQRSRNLCERSRWASPWIGPRWSPVR